MDDVGLHNVLNHLNHKMFIIGMPGIYGISYFKKVTAGKKRAFVTAIVGFIIALLLVGISDPFFNMHLLGMALNPRNLSARGAFRLNSFGEVGPEVTVTDNTPGFLKTLVFMYVIKMALARSKKARLSDPMWMGPSGIKAISPAEISALVLLPL